MDKNGLEGTVVQLIEYQAKNDVNQTSILLMLSLVNLMGIVNIMHQTNAIEHVNIPHSLPRDETPSANPNQELMEVLKQAAAGQLDPAQLLSLLNTPGRQMPNPAALMGMLSQMMPPPQHAVAKKNSEPGPQPVKTKKEVTDSPGETEVNKELEKGREDEKASHQKGFLKWDPRLG